MSTEVPLSTQAAPSSGAETAKITYVLYFVGLVSGLTMIVGLIIAYVNQDSAADWVKTHYRFLIRTFWIGLLYSVIASILCLAVIGFLLLPVVWIWFVIRCVKGVSALGRNEPYPNPTTWTF